MNMEGYTISEMATLLEISPANVLKRLQRKGIKPINREVIYDKSALEDIKEVKSVGRPKKQSEPEPESGRPGKQPEPEKPVSKSKKTK